MRWSWDNQEIIAWTICSRVNLNVPDHPNLSRNETRKQFRTRNWNSRSCVKEKKILELLTGTAFIKILKWNLENWISWTLSFPRHIGTFLKDPGHFRYVAREPINFDPLKHGKAQLGRKWLIAFSKFRFAKIPYWWTCFYMPAKSNLQAYSKVSSRNQNVLKSEI